MTREPNEVFLTGVTGFLGHYVLGELLKHPHIRCRVLLRPPASESSARLDRLLADIGLNLSALIAEERVVPVEGELPNSVNPSEMVGSDVVVHAAGNTTFDANGSGEPTRTNAEGTRALLSLATEAKIGRFLHVSTAYVCGDQTCDVPEVCCTTMPPLRNDYERSKWQAEQLVCEWGTRCGVATICRPSILFGDSRTGRATSMKGLYLVARATEVLARAVAGSSQTDRHRVPVRILGHPEATCNVIPVDWAARQIARLVLKPEAESSVHHITNPDSPTHKEVKRWLEEYFDIAGGQFSEATWPLEDANHYEELFYSLGNICLAYFRDGLHFESRSAASIPSGCRLVDQKAFSRCLQYAQATNWRRPPIEPLPRRPPGGQIDSKWYFECFLPRAVPRSVVAKMEELTAVVQYTITGANGGSWISRFQRGRLEETHPVPTNLQPEFEYQLSHADLVDVVTGRKPLQDVFFHGSAEMSGDLDRALKMVPIIGEFLKEFPIVDDSVRGLDC